MVEDQLRDERYRRTVEGRRAQAFQDSEDFSAGLQKAAPLLRDKVGGLPTSEQWSVAYAVYQQLNDGELAGSGYRIIQVPGAFISTALGFRRAVPALLEVMKQPTPALDVAKTPQPVVLELADAARELASGFSSDTDESRDSFFRSFTAYIARFAEVTEFSKLTSDVNDRPNLGMMVYQDTARFEYRTQGWMRKLKDQFASREVMKGIIEYPEFFGLLGRSDALSQIYRDYWIYGAPEMPASNPAFVRDAHHLRGLRRDN
jgi:hypothetical protein